MISENTEIAPLPLNSFIKSSKTLIKIHTDKEKHKEIVTGGHEVITHPSIEQQELPPHDVLTVRYILPPEVKLRTPSEGLIHRITNRHEIMLDRVHLLTQFFILTVRLSTFHLIIYFLLNTIFLLSIRVTKGAGFCF